MPARLITPPASEPVTLAEAKAHLRLEHTLDDVYVTTLITAARQYAEKVCWRGLLQQTWELVVDGFHGDNLLEQRRPVRGSWQGDWSGAGHRALSHWEDFIELPQGQLAVLDANASPVSSVKYVDGNGVLQTLDPSGYDVDIRSVPGRIRLPYGLSWPDTRAQWDAVRIQYVVGWRTDSTDPMPTPIKQALLLLLSNMYENRVPETGGRLSSLEFSIDALLGPYRLVRV